MTLPAYSAPRSSHRVLRPGLVSERNGFALAHADAWRLHGTGQRSPGRQEVDAALARPTPPLHGASILTGGAGFLGARLAAELLDDAQPHPVVVASRRPSAVVERWAEAYGPERARVLSSDPRLRLVPADLREPGGTDAVRAAVADGPVATVFHLAAHVHAFAGYERLRDANVGTTEAALDLAEATGARLQLASTLSVFVSSNDGGEGREETLSDRDDLMLYGGYAQTKAVAEVAAGRRCALSGVPVQVIRYGLLMPERGALLPDDHFLVRFVGALLDVGAIPDEGEEAWVDLTPVAHAAAAAIAVAGHEANGVHHYAHPTGASLSQVLGHVQDALEASGRPRLPVTEAAGWRSRVEALPSLPAMLLRSAFGKSAFLASEAARGPYLNADLFQSTGRRYAKARAEAAGAVAPPPADDILRRLMPDLVESRRAAP